MSSIQLDLTPLDNAIARLDEGWTRYQRDVSDIQIRDGLIQRFEFTYEISHKMLRRFLELTSANPAEFDGMAFQDMIRTGNERGLLLVHDLGSGALRLEQGLGADDGGFHAATARKRSRRVTRPT